MPTCDHLEEFNKALPVSEMKDVCKAMATSTATSKSLSEASALAARGRSRGVRTITVRSVCDYPVEETRIWRWDESEIGNRRFL